MMHRFFIFLPLAALLLPSVLLGSCGSISGGRNGNLALMTWNTQNLFDDVKDGGEYPEFDPDRGWDRSRYWARLEKCAAVITGSGPRVPDVVLLQELENPQVLETLRTRFLDPRQYPWSLMVPVPAAMVKVGILSRWPIVRSGVLLPEDAQRGGRPILEAAIQTPWGDVTLFNNHWKSRIPDRESTEGARMALARLLDRRIRALQARGDYFIVAGDFNTYPVPGVFGALGYGSLGVIGIAGGEPRPQGGTGLLRDLWEGSSHGGSYFYRGKWEPLDHILIPETEGVSADFRVLFPEEGCGEDGVPLAWSLRMPQGISDHLPLWAEITFHSGSGRVP